MKEKQIQRIKEVQSDVFDSEQFFSESDNKKIKNDFSKSNPRNKKNSHISLKIVDEENKSDSQDSDQNLKSDRFKIKKPKKKPRTFGEVVDLESTNDLSR